MIQLKNLERSYKTPAGQFFVLRRANLEIREGEFITVMGPSGAGKSSLLNVLALLDDGWEGEYWFREQAVHQIHDGSRRVAPFAPRYQSGGTLVRADEPIRQALLLVRSLYNAKLANAWATLYEPTAFFVGQADDLTYRDYQTLMAQIYGDAPAPAALVDDAQLARFQQAAAQLAAPRAYRARMNRRRRPAARSASAQ